MDGMFPALDPQKCLKTYGKADRPTLKLSEDGKPLVQQDSTPPKTYESKQLTTKDALQLLLEGTLKSKVCRYCLQVVPQLSHLDQILEVAGKGTFYKVAIKDMVASFHPFKVADDPNFPDKICENCLDHAISSYLFTQQCERAERALRNCFEDISDKLYKLDPLEKTKKRGRHKLNPNYNKIYAEHEKVMDYAESVINLVNTTSEVLTEQAPLSKLECLKCCEILPNLESLLNHTKKHPTSMWYNCRLCGTSFSKQYQLKKHFNMKHNEKSVVRKTVTYDCRICDAAFEKCHEYLLHIEKHKFKTLMEHLVEKKMNRLCALCFNKGSEMIPLHEIVYLNGICPELHGDKPLRTMLSYIMPDIYFDTHTDMKICEKCLNNALASYVFITQSHFAKHRLGTCVTAMLDKLNEFIKNNNNICVEIAPNLIMNVPYDISNVDDDELKMEVLEDEFRIKLEDESDSESMKKEPSDEVDERMPMLNGFKYANKICGEFLTFKKKKPSKQKFTCPVCLKHFISDYFLKRHCLKHIQRNIKCDACYLKLDSKFQLFEHKKMVHVLNNIDYGTCEICQRCYAANEKLLCHKKRHKNPLCQICDKKFKSQATYINHMRKHMKKMTIIMKNYQKLCKFCEKNCTNDNEFLRHINKLHLELKPYSCNMCDHTFYTESDLRSHRRLHSVYRKEKCELCDKILYSRKKLVIHIRKHMGEMPFSCQICDSTFYSEMLLKKHLITHHRDQFAANCAKQYLQQKRN